MEVGMDTFLIIIAAIVLLGLGAVLGWAFFGRKRTQDLRTKFGPEYEYLVEKTADQREAEAELEKRQKRIEDLDIHPLTPEQYEQFKSEWKVTQALFVDDPAGAVAEADQLITEVMEAEGYPVSDFEQQAADLSVGHAQVVANYRVAHDIALAHQRGEATTEDLREAMVYYRSLFQELLDTRAFDKPEKELI
jgi:hypothetical protein